jgi:hypothetical protein
LRRRRLGNSAMFIRTYLVSFTAIYLLKTC